MHDARRGPSVDDDVIAVVFGAAFRFRRVEYVYE